MANEQYREPYYGDPEAIADGFGHVEGRIDDLETTLAGILYRLADAETREERHAAITAAFEGAVMPSQRRRLAWLERK